MNLNEQSRRDMPENSSMVKDEQDLIKHSKIMENMITNTELEKEKQHPDPKQYGETDPSK
ncbi:hypothetical protein [Bacillus suaedaesalsae]|uniref:Multidrug ABC transporter ATPase n=1 Tax=Bacillus suaedaesalsae TaxID=2810349 RepID=A0ABS2DEW5_9BACI|nr:hypothetical protein [Bacillus suaedaesalsae]MBM6617000.1 hypothetical protein [Bacillus suaedaesalsae]